MNEIFKAIVIKGLRIRKNQGEEPADILEGYRNLTKGEKVEILAVLERSSNGEDMDTWGR